MTLDASTTSYGLGNNNNNNYYFNNQNGCNKDAHFSLASGN